MPEAAAAFAANSSLSKSGLFYCITCEEFENRAEWSESWFPNHFRVLFFRIRFQGRDVATLDLEWFRSVRQSMIASNSATFLKEISHCDAAGDWPDRDKS